MLPIADGLAERGHSVTLAVPDVGTARRQIGRSSHPLVPAPVWKGPAQPGFVASSYAQVLQQAGYANPAALHTLLSDWLARFEAVWPDLVVADFAPTAMLAARTAGLPVVALGNGYTLPPRRTPLPFMRPWAQTMGAQTMGAQTMGAQTMGAQTMGLLPLGAKPSGAQQLGSEPSGVTLAVPESDHVASEAAVLAEINAALAIRGASPLPALEALFEAQATFLCSFAELDHYEDRGQADYYGAIYDDQTGQPPVWPTGAGERVFGYLNARHRPPAPLIEALDKLGLPSVLHVTGLSSSTDAADLSRPSVRVTSSPVQVAAALAGCDIVVCQGIGTIAAALVASRPVLVLPAYVEQMMTLHRVLRQGYGHGVQVKADADAISAALRRLLDDAGCRRNVANFARSYAGYHPSLATEAITDELSNLPALT
jgi:hypothetical protein